MNKKELVDRVSSETGLTKKKTEEVLNIILEIITKSLEEKEPVTLLGFGTFLVKTRAARSGRNPASGQLIRIASSESPAFKPGKRLISAVHGDPTGGGGPGKKAD